MINTNEVTKYTKNLSILFVEDHEEVKLATANILNNLFKVSDSCSNGKEAFLMYMDYKQRNEKFYDIVLTDIELPFMNGIDLTEKIYHENPSQVVIVLSAFDDAKYLLRLINIGIEQFIKKPIGSQELLKSFYQVSQKILNTDEVDLDAIEITLAEDVVYNKDSKTVNTKEENIYLTKFEIIFVELLLSSIGKIFTSEDIVVHYINLGEKIDASNIRKLVSKLRKKIPENSLESIYGIGYKFIQYH